MAGNKAFGERLRALREAKLKDNPSFTLRQFAAMVDMSPTYLSKVERGEFDPPAADKVKKIAELLGVNADELLAQANRVDAGLTDIIKDKPTIMPDLLRTASGLSNEQLARLLAQAKRMKPEGRP